MLPLRSSIITSVIGWTPLSKTVIVLLLAVVVDLEIVLGEIGNEASLFVRDGHINGDGPRTAPENLPGLRCLLLRSDEDHETADDQHGKSGAHGPSGFLNCSKIESSDRARLRHTLSTVVLEAHGGFRDGSRRLVRGKSADAWGLTPSDPV